MRRIRIRALRRPEQTAEIWQMRGRAVDRILPEILLRALSRSEEQQMIVLCGMRVRETLQHLVEAADPYQSVLGPFGIRVVWVPQPLDLRGQRFFQEMTMTETITKPTQATVRKPMGPRKKPAPRRPKV
jgi:hypothetical protein